MGREEDIDQQRFSFRNKFLMLTGASGMENTGFSGIIPNARAGFLKSKYTNWRPISDPNAHPFEFASALAKQLDISNLIRCRES
jgi:hypothetical protein